MWSHWNLCNIFLAFIKWNIDEIIQTFIPSDLKININIHFLSKATHKTVHFLKILDNMNKVIFSDFTLHNFQLFKWRYMSGIWVRTKSYLWGNNGEQPEVTWPKVTSPEVTWPKVTAPEVTWSEESMSGTENMLCACATGRFAISLVGLFHRKWREWPEVIMCACATGTFCITTRVVVQVHGCNGWRVCACPTEVGQYPPSEAFSPEVGYRWWRHFPAHFS